MTTAIPREQWGKSPDWLAGFDEGIARMGEELKSFPPARMMSQYWQLIETMPKDERQILACTEDGRIMIWSAEMLARVMSGKQPFHLQFPATYWMPLPETPTPKRHTVSGSDAADDDDL